MDIRAGTVDDIPAVLPLAAGTVAFHQALDPARFGAVPDAAAGYDGWLRRLAGNDTDLFLVAEVDGSVVGFVIGVLDEGYRMYRVRRYGFIHDLWVEPSCRQKGIGRALVLAGIEHFRGVGAEQVRLDTAASNETAQRLFGACGFRRATIEMLVELDRQPV